MQPQDSLTVLADHRSIRQFANQAVPEETLHRLLAVAQTASTSSNLQAYSVIRIDDPGKRRRIAELAGNQRHVLEAPVFLVFCADLYRLKVAGELIGKEFNSDFIESFIVSTVDTAIFAQNFMAAAELIGLGGVYIGGIRNDMEEMIRLLELPSYTYPLFGMCLGYPDPERLPEKKPRLALRAVLHQDRYEKEKTEESIRAYDDVMREYFRARSSANRDSTWSEHILSQYGEPRRTAVRMCLEAQRFGLR